MSTENRTYLVGNAQFCGAMECVVILPEKFTDFQHAFYPDLPVAGIENTWRDEILYFLFYSTKYVILHLTN